MGFPVIFLIARILGLQFLFPFDSLERHIALDQSDKLRAYCRMTYQDDSQEVVEAVIASKSVVEVKHSDASTWKIRFIVALVVIASNQVSGINGILYYAKQLFSKVTEGK